MAKRNLRLVAPAIVKRTVMPKRAPNAELRTREYLTEAEVERLMKAATRNRWGHRDATMILVTYRHGLRASELVDLRWDQVELRTATLHVRRVKQGIPSTHPILGDELRALRRLQREQEPKSPFVFTSRTGSAVQHRWLRPHGRTRGQGGQAGVQGAPTHASARLRLCLGQQGARYPRLASLSGA
jgi:integrase